MFKSPQSIERLIIVNFLRLLFIGLIIFELLNFFGLLDFDLEFTWLGLIITAALSLVLLEITAHHYYLRKGHYLHWSVWLILLVALSLDVMGDIFHLYGRVNWWDQIVHFSTNAVMCFILFVIISAFWIDKFKFSLLFKTGRLKLSLLLAATLSMSISALYEIEEYIEDLIFNTHRLGPGTDTANDLVFNLGGILMVVIFLSLYYLVTHKRKIFD